MFMIECKKKGERPTKIQELRLQNWADAGCWAVWTDDLAEIKQLFITHFL
jgi:hypothetical protein